MYRGQPGYAPHLDADGDGSECEWSWRNGFRF
ncbi:excalibur calcium-binding domain-containing protein [Microvirga sp. M2]